MLLAGFALLSLCFVSVSVGKVCTNGGVSLSHTHRSRLFSSNSKNEPLEGGEDLSHLHLSPSDDQTWSTLIPRKMLRQEDEVSWNILYRKIKNSNGPRNGGMGFLNEESLHHVRLDPNSLHGLAQQTNLDYLLMLDNDRLVWSFRRVAGLETPGDPYGGWESPNQELRGHFVGHYMSASALMWASTHNAELKEKMSSLVALSECQKKIGTGYLSAFPSEFFDRFEALEQVWAPYYTIHKILAGLLDQYALAENVQALNMTNWMVDYFYKRVKNVIAKHTIERHWQSLNEETGGMNDVLYRLYAITGDRKHLVLAHLFDKPCFLGLLAMKADDISDFHSNTHIPVVVGSQMRYEVTGDPLYKEIGTFFMDIVNSSHSYATGGTSVGEFWSDPKRLGTTLETENEESCTTYNMLKVSRHLFRWTKEMIYADYYERALTNGVLGNQRGREPGVMIYMLPLQPGGSKARSYHKWGTKFDSFWCCYGTGIESFSKLGDSIYFEEEGSSLALYVVQYISSSIDWKAGQFALSQIVEPVVSWDPRIRITIAISKAEGTLSTLMLRIPPWTSSAGAKATLNGNGLLLPEPGNFLSISRNWEAGDEICLDLPLSVRTEAIKDERRDFTSVGAFLYGPYVLAGLSSGNWDVQIALPIVPIPAHCNAHLITITQDLENSTSIFALKNSGRVIKMGKFPEHGTDSALEATFGLVAGPNETVRLEPFDLPGMYVSHDGENKTLGISILTSSDLDESTFFRLVVPGLDGGDGTVSFESESRKGCFVYGEEVGVTLNCSYDSSDVGFRRATSFVIKDGIAEYHPMSFVAKGRERNFVLVPLLSLMDESYTVYFNMSVV